MLMSDWHRGVGNHADNLLKNRNLAFAALSHYYKNGFSYVELGDGEELWENRRMEPIIQAHSDIYRLLSRFYREGRLLMLYGNHDRVKGSLRYLRENGTFENLFPEIEAREAVILEEEGTGNEIFLVHGHQGDLLNDRFWRLSRFLVRYVWKRMELMGFLDPTSAAKNYKRKKKTEKRLAAWAWRKDVLLVAGHTHRPVLPLPGESLYLNDGSCVHPDCITALEIENGLITLVKWCTSTRPDKTLYVKSEILEGPVRLRDYFVYGD